MVWGGSMVWGGPIGQCHCVRALTRKWTPCETNTRAADGGCPSSRHHRLKHRMPVAAAKQTLSCTHSPSMLCVPARSLLKGPGDGHPSHHARRRQAAAARSCTHRRLTGSRHAGPPCNQTEKSELSRCVLACRLLHGPRDDRPFLITCNGSKKQL